jgi:hypothetical protein
MRCRIRTVVEVECLVLAIAHVGVDLARPIVMFACHHGLSLGLSSALLRGDLMTTRLCLLLVGFRAHSLCTRSFFVGSCTRVLSSSLAMLRLLTKRHGFLTAPL